MIIKAVLIKNEIEIFDIEVNENNLKLVKKKLINVNKQLVDILKKYKKQGKINSLSLPRDVKNLRYRSTDGKMFSRPNKTEFQKELDKIVNAKRIIKDSLRKLTIFYT